MTAHFWLSTDAITITQESIGAMTDDQARLFLAELRWGSADQQVCPECGAIDRHYNIRTRRQWRCKHCLPSRNCDQSIRPLSCASDT